MHAVSAVTRHSCLLVESATHSFLCGLQPHRSTCGLPDGLGPRACSGIGPVQVPPRTTSCMGIFAYRISRTNCCHWNAVEFNLNSNWINEEVKWLFVSNFAGRSSLTMHSGIAVSYAILFLVCKSNHFQLTHRHSKHSVFFQCFASCGVSLPLCVNSVQSYHESHFFICIKFNDLVSFPYKNVDVCYKSAFDA